MSNDVRKPEELMGVGHLTLPSDLTQREPEPLEPIQVIPKEFTWMKPTLGRVLLKEFPMKDRTDTGIWLAGVKDGGGNICEVVEVCDPYWAAGDDTDKHAPEGPMFKIGQVVVIGKYNGVDVQIGRTTYISCNESDIIGVMKTDEDRAQ